MTRCPGYFIYQHGSKKSFLALYQPCHCTVNGGDQEHSHPWMETCDRHPPVIAEIDGREVDRSEFDAYANSSYVSPLLATHPLNPAQEYAYQVATNTHYAKHGKPNLRELPPITP